MKGQFIVSKRNCKKKMPGTSVRSSSSKLRLIDLLSHKNAQTVSFFRFAEGYTLQSIRYNSYTFVEERKEINNDSRL